MKLQKSIFQTIAFFDLFDFPLTAEEIKEYLYKYDKPLHIKEIKGTLEEMETIEKIHDYFVLKGRSKLVDMRKARKFIAEKFWGRVRQYGQYIVKVPFVKMVAVCNNLAYDNPNELSDIDLFIVIKKGRMWTARLLITLILHFFGVRRHKNKIVGRFCLSFFVTPEAMKMEELSLKPKDPYLAYWTKLLMPIYGEETYKQFMTENEQWLKKEYGLNFENIENKKFTFHGQSNFKKIAEWILGGFIGNLIENILKKTFKKRTIQKSKNLGPESNVVVTDKILKFHNHDKRKEYCERWEKKVSN